MKKEPWKWLVIPVVVALLFRRDKAKATTTTTRPPPTPGPEPRPKVKSAFPVKGGKLSDKPIHQFGFQRTPTHKHHGVDIFGREGTPVVAPIGGTIVHVNREYRKHWGGYGRAIVERVQLGGQTAYVMFAHLASIQVQEGDRVVAGQQLGTVGRTAFTDADPTKLFDESNAHLHIELSMRKYPMEKEGPRIDPTPYLKRLE